MTFFSVQHDDLNALGVRRRLRRGIVRREFVLRPHDHARSVNHKPAKMRTGLEAHPSLERLRLRGEFRFTRFVGRRKLAERLAGGRG